MTICPLGVLWRSQLLDLRKDSVGPKRPADLPLQTGPQSIRIQLERFSAGLLTYGPGNNGQLTFQLADQQNP